VFRLFKSSPSSVPGNLAGLRCDMHSHLIPGIDDGAPDMETSVRLVRGLCGLGYRKIITTPHINGEIFPNTPEKIRQLQAALTAELERQQIEVELHAAAEYLIDDHFTQALEAGEPLLTLKDNLVLVELSFAPPALNLPDILFLMQMRGYRPVLAHPERYIYFSADKGWYDRLRDAGCLFQLNLLSFTGHYGRDARQLAAYLIRKDYVDLLGTDLHRDHHLRELHSPIIAKKVNNLLRNGRLLNPGL
jgi:protein-tyrosine phosphatase